VAQQYTNNRTGTGFKNSFFAKFISGDQHKSETL